MRQRLYRIHAWIGLNLGLLLFAICFSGTAAVFSAELMWLSDPALRVSAPAPDARAVTWQAMHDAAAQAHPLGRVAYLHAPRGERWAAAATVAYSPQDFRTVLIDPYTGVVQGHRSDFSLASFLRIFHKQLYVVPSVHGMHGTLITGALAIPLLVTVVAGLLSVSRWWHALVTLRVGRSPRLFWSDLHRASGLWSLLVALLLCLTGIWYLAEILLDRSGVFPDEIRPTRLQAEQIGQRPADLMPLDLDRAAALARAAYPALVIDDIRLPARPDDTLGFTGQAEAWWVRDRANGVELDPYSGAVLKIRRGTALPALERWAETADPLHFGTFGGLATRILWLMAGLGLSGGILAGLYSAWLRLRRHGLTLSKHPLSAALVVLPTLLLLLVCIHGTLVYGVVRSSIATTPIAVATLGRIELGGRPATVRWYEPASSPAAMQIAVQFDGPAQPNFRQALFWIGEEAVPPAALRPAARLVDRLTGQAALPDCARRCRLHILIEGWDGRRQQAQLVFDPRGQAAPPAVLPLARSMSGGEIGLLAGFLLCLLLPLLGWIRLHLPARK